MSAKNAERGGKRGGTVFAATFEPGGGSRLRLLLVGLVALLAVAAPARLRAYSVLSHEEVVDMAWKDQLLPLLNARFPGLTPDQIREAHAYAYGGCLIQDIGYYPFGDHQFSDMLHYVRTDAFVEALNRDASTADEMAFALGALAHYYGDTLGHPIINVITGEEYPHLRSRFGRFVTYADDHTAHLRTEFGFDVVEVAHGNYSQENYRDFIGFQVSKDLLERAFLETYGLNVKDVMKHEDLAVSTYRYSVSNLIPQMTKVAMVKYRKDIQTTRPGYDLRQFRYRMRRTEFEQKYGKQYAHAGFGAHLMAFVLTIVPKVGPLRALRMSMPTPDEQKQYVHSINEAETAYRAQLKSMRSSANPTPSLSELDFDTGKPTAEGEYPLADRSYAEWARQLASKKDAQPTPEQIAELRRFYRQGTAAAPSAGAAAAPAKDTVQADPKQWQALQSALTTLHVRS